jgi:hypothetical protein
VGSLKEDLFSIGWNLAMENFEYGFGRVEIIH